MNKKIITTLIAASILIIFFSMSINAEIFSTIGMKGLSFANPQAAKVVQTVVCASNPAACAAGYVTGQVSGEIMGEVAKQSPEAAKAIQQYNEINGWVKEGAQIKEDLKLNEHGEMAGGKILLTGDEPRDVSKLVSEDEEKESIMAANMEVSSKTEGGPVTFTAKGDYGRIEVDKKSYSNMQEGSEIEVNRGGSIQKADITTNGGTYEFPNDITHQWQSVQAKEKGTRVTYNQENNWEIKIDRKEKNIPVNVQVDDEFYIEKGTSIEVKSQAEGKEVFTKVTGEDFTTDNRRFTGQEGQTAEIKLLEGEQGQVLGKNTIAEDKEIDITVETSQEEVMFSKSCQDISGYDNYVSYCGAKMNGQGDLYVEMEEGNNFGLTMTKDDNLKYELAGGKLTVDNGEQTIIPEEGGFVYITNGEMETKYTKSDGITEELMDTDSLGKPDVSASTKYDEVVSLTEDGVGEEVYVCPQEITGATVTGAPILENIKNIKEQCKQAVKVIGEGVRGVTNQIFGTGQKEIFAGQFVVSESKIVEFKQQDGIITYEKTFTTQDGSQFTVSSDGSVRMWNDQTRNWEKLDHTFDKKYLDYLGVKPTGTAAPTVQPRETGQKTIDVVTKMEDKSQKVFERELQHSIETGKLGKGELFVGPTKEGYIFGSSDPNSRIRNFDYLMEPVRDSSGKVTGYINTADNTRWEIVKDEKTGALTNRIRKVSR